ncbi:hypothetical protein FDP22_12025 [Paroceanicella profunda]|uniref:Uncharacterized protein n=1 Tax=Paroceanicella profunda TaxID=2579971 RepID=A0A5B8G1Q4_9RHOB|nr:DUF6505 family protein [Paroceanicella profunda]QDL92443.1 hypothetical protein FDP22_12025 [Paroceanicella profunda]
MKLARTLRLDESDLNVFARPAESDEWAIPGSFEFANWDESHLVGKARQAFANGWLGLESFGRSTFVAVARLEPAEREACVARLAAHFIEAWGAPSPEAARAVAEQEIAFMQELCEGHAPNTLLVIGREMSPDGVREAYRAIAPVDAELEAFAIHGSADPEPE